MRVQHHRVHHHDAIRAAGRLVAHLSDIVTAMADPPAFTTRQMRGLQVLCDTFVAPVPPPRARAGDPTGFFRRRASDVGAPDAVAAHLLRTLTDQERAATGQLLDLIAVSGFRLLPQAGREIVLAGLGRTSADVAEGLAGLAALTAFHVYGSVGPDGRNPAWAETGYPGPPTVDAPPSAVTVHRPTVTDGVVALDADVVVVGSGSGGSVIAATLAAAGMDVVVLEAGGHLTEADMPTDDATGFATTYWRGGVQPTVDRNLAVLAGATLGGGSTINWQNCVRPPQRVLDVWARDHGLVDLADGGLDAHLDAVADRISITTGCSDHNGANQRLLDGAKALGWSAHVAARNVDPNRYDPDSAGHVAFGDRSGAKQSALRTWLPDAVSAGARLLVHARATRIRREAGRAAGVVGTIVVDGATYDLQVHAPRVVVACGALETPALLHRSAVGGPAVGRHLRVHPAAAAFGLYDDPQDGWWGGPMTAVVDQHTDLLAGHGYLIEAGHSHQGLAAASLPWRSARQHELVMARGDRLAGSVAVVRDHGSGRVDVDADGEAVISWPAEDPVDRELVWRGVADMIRLHAAAGAAAVFDYALPDPVWRRGQDVEAAARRAADVPLGRGGRVPFCAHQMGSARMGTDPADAVADPHGQLHDLPGAWIGDTSAFPTAIGANPMWTCMALARRTAEAIRASR